MPDDVPIVREYLPVFLDDLLGLLPDFEIEFCIKVIPESAPISEPLIV